jgi:hypothetical protein
VGRGALRHGHGPLQRNLAREAANLDGFRKLVARRPGRQQAAPNPVERDEELAEQLRSLGYTR